MAGLETMAGLRLRLLTKRPSTNSKTAGNTAQTDALRKSSLHNTPRGETTNIYGHLTNQKQHIQKQKSVGQILLARPGFAEHCITTGTANSEDKKKRWNPRTN